MRRYITSRQQGQRDTKDEFDVEEQGQDFLE